MECIVKITVSLPDDIGRAVQAEAVRRQRSKSEVMRQAVATAASGFEQPAPQGGFMTGDWEPIDWNSDDCLEGFGSRDRNTARA
jgi:hypothetical protein